MAVPGSIPQPSYGLAVDILDEARANCADRLRAWDSIAEAEAFARGERDGAWAMKHELAKLRAERGLG